LVASCGFYRIACLADVTRIGIDATSVSPDGKGIARVQRHTVEALAALGLRHELVVFYRDSRAPELLPREAELVAVRSPRTIVWEQLGLCRAVKDHGLDVVLTWTERLPLRGGGHYVVWLFESPSHRIAQNRLVGASAYQRASDLLTTAIWRRSLRRAAAVVSGSAATAADLRREVPELGAVQPVYPGLTAEFSPGPSTEAGRYVFHLSSSDPRDNTEAVLAAYAAARSRLDDPPELLVGGGLGARDPILRARAGAGIHFLGRVSDERLVDLYRGALAYLDATLYEGFGYQVLEAMACGAPVVASWASSIPEVVGDAGLLCPPNDTEELAAALVRIVSEPRLAEELRSRGLRRAAEFTWQRTARALADVIDAALE
jgi:glycosyltransferase involved in cell wall biosynthesis